MNKIGIFLSYSRPFQKFTARIPGWTPCEIGPLVESGIDGIPLGGELRQYPGVSCELHSFVAFSTFFPNYIVSFRIVSNAHKKEMQEVRLFWTAVYRYMHTTKHFLSNIRKFHELCHIQIGKKPATKQKKNLFTHQVASPDLPWSSYDTIPGPSPKSGKSFSTTGTCTGS